MPALHQWTNGMCSLGYPGAATGAARRSLYSRQLSLMASTEHVPEQSGLDDFAKSLGEPLQEDEIAAAKVKISLCAEVLFVTVASIQTPTPCRPSYDMTLPYLALHVPLPPTGTP